MGCKAATALLDLKAIKVKMVKMAHKVPKATADFRAMTVSKARQETMAHKVQREMMEHKGFKGPWGTMVKAVHKAQVAKMETKDHRDREDLRVWVCKATSASGFKDRSGLAYKDSLE